MKSSQAGRFQHDGDDFFGNNARGILIPYPKPWQYQLAQSHDTIYDPYAFPFSGSAAPRATDIDCFITNSRVVTSVPTLIMSNPISP